MENLLFVSIIRVDEVTAGDRHFTPVPHFIIFCPEDIGSWHVTWVNLHHTPSPSQLLSLCQIEVFMVVAVKNTASWEVMPYSLVSLVQPTLFLWKVGTFVWGYMGSLPRSLSFSNVHKNLLENLNVCHILIYCSLNFYSDICLNSTCQVNCSKFFIFFFRWLHQDFVMKPKVCWKV